MGSAVHLKTYVTEEEMATHCRILAWRIPRTEGPGGLYSQSMGSQMSTAFPRGPEATAKGRQDEAS